MQYKKDDVRDRIVSAALSEFERHGYRGALISRIAGAAGVPVGNLYRYFTSKEQLYTAVVENVSENLPTAIRAIYDADISSDRNAKETFMHIADALVHIYKEYGRQLLLLIDHSEGTPYENFFSELMRQIANLFEDGLPLAKTPENHIMCAIIAHSFMECLFSILRTANDDNRETLLQKLILFYFYRIEDRLK